MKTLFVCIALIGCIGQCQSSPCFAGSCQKGYGREVGINLWPNYKMLYTLNELQSRKVFFDYARVGFSTSMKQGILLQLRNEVNTEYISIQINNNGGVKVVLDVGFGRHEVNTGQDIYYTDGQKHELVVRRSNRGGHTIHVQVDNNISKVVTFPVSPSSDVLLDDPKFMYLGNNYTSDPSNGYGTNGFEGCIFDVQLDDIFPLKEANQDPRPSYITFTPIAVPIGLCHARVVGK